MGSCKFSGLFTSIKNISRWASRHPRTAILLLVLCEVANALNGLLLGINLLADWPEGSLLLFILGLLAGAFFLQTRSGRVASMQYWVGRRWLFGAFMTNFLLFILLGGLWASGVQAPTASRTAWGNHRITIQSDTLIRPKNVRPSNPAYYEERTPINEQPVRNQTGKRIGFVLLFLLGVVVSVYSVALACTLACAGNGTLAFIVLLSGTGIFLGSFFLLSRAFDRVIKPWKLMNRRERKRVYLRALLLFLTFWVLSAVLGGAA